MRKNLKIAESCHIILKKYCDENHLKISDWATSILLKEIEERTKCISTKLPTQKMENVT
jgi:hypothetical protein